MFRLGTSLDPAVHSIRIDLDRNHGTSVARQSSSRHAFRNLSIGLYVQHRGQEGNMVAPFSHDTERY